VFLSEISGTWQSTEELRHLRRISFLLDDRQDGSNCGFGGLGSIFDLRAISSTKLSIVESSGIV